MSSDEQAMRGIRELASRLAQGLQDATPPGTSVPRFMASLGFLVDTLLDQLHAEGHGHAADDWLDTLMSDKPVRRAKSFDAMLDGIFGQRRGEA